MRKKMYLMLSIVGAVIPYIFFTNFILHNGFNLSFFIFNAFANNVSSGFAWDLIITSFVFWIWAYRDGQKNKIRYWWIVIPCNLLIGLSCAFPLYLYMRERNLKK